MKNIDLIRKAKYLKPLVISKKIQFQISTFSTTPIYDTFGPREAPRRKP